VSAFLGRTPAREKQPGAAPPVPSADGSKGKPPARAADPAAAGRLYYHLDLGLATIRPDGKKPTDLTRLSDKDLQGYQLHSARLSPDGKRLAFGKAVTKQVGGGLGVFPPDNLYVREVARTADAELLVQMPGAELHEWCWSPDGTRLALASWDAQNHTRNWVVNARTKKVEEVKLPRYQVEGKEYAMSLQAWSPDGAWFLAAGDGLHLVKTDGSASRRLTPPRTDLLGGSYRFAPDGRKVLFVGCNADKSQTLYVAEVPGGKVTAVVEAKNFGDLAACWSPDGRRLAYCVTPLDGNGNRLGETSLFVADADGSNTVTVLTEKHAPNQIRLSLLDWR
jgi:Tol biopolymer transport system component